MLAISGAAMYSLASFAFEHVSAPAAPYIVFVGRLLQGMGADVVSAVVPALGSALKALENVEIVVGDLEDLEADARAQNAQILLTNSHGAETAERLGIPLLRIGFPQYDQVGGFQRQWFGYRATSQALFDLANLVLSQHHELEPYYSVYAQKYDEKHQQVKASAWS